MFLRKGVLKICSKFTGEHPCPSAISIKFQSNFIEIALQHGNCPVNLLHISRIPFPRNTSGWLLLLVIIYQTVFQTLRGRGFCDIWSEKSYGQSHMVKWSYGQSRYGQSQWQNIKNKRYYFLKANNKGTLIILMKSFWSLQFFNIEQILHSDFTIRFYTLCSNFDIATLNNYTHAGS